MKWIMTDPLAIQYYFGVASGTSGAAAIFALIKADWVGAIVAGVAGLGFSIAGAVHSLNVKERGLSIWSSSANGK